MVIRLSLWLIYGHGLALGLPEGLATASNKCFVQEWWIFDAFLS